MYERIIRRIDPSVTEEAAAGISRTCRADA